MKTFQIHLIDSGSRMTGPAPQTRAPNTPCWLANRGRALLCASLACVLPCSSSARDLLDYWPSHQEHQVLNALCPDKVQHWLAEQDQLAGRLFFSRIVDQKIPIEALVSTYQELSRNQLTSIRQKGLAYLRHLRPHPILREMAEDRCEDVVEGYASRGFYFAPNNINGYAEEPGVRGIEVPVSRSDEEAELDYVLVAATDSLNGMTVPIKIVVVEEGNERVVLAKDVRAFARGIAVVQWTSRYNGVATCRLEFLKSSVFEKRKGDERSICDWSVAIGRRGRTLKGGSMAQEASRTPIQAKKPVPQNPSTPASTVLDIDDRAFPRVFVKNWNAWLVFEQSIDRHTQVFQEERTGRRYRMKVVQTALGGKRSLRFDTEIHLPGLEFTSNYYPTWSHTPNIPVRPFPPTTNPVSLAGRR